MNPIVIFSLAHKLGIIYSLIQKIPAASILLSIQIATPGRNANNKFKQI